MNTNIIPTQIGMRELVRNAKKISEAVNRGEEFEVYVHSVPTFRVSKIEPKKVIKYTWEDLKKIQFSSGDKHLADNIDKIVYGI